MKLRTFVSAMLLSSSFTLQALPWDTTTETQIDNKDSPAHKDIAHRVYSLFRLLNQANFDKSAIQLNTLKPFFNEDVSYEINGKLVSSSLETLQARWKRSLQHLKRFNIQLPPQSIVVHKNKAIITYKIDEVYNDNREFHNLVSVVLLFDEGKISEWNAVIEHT